MENTKKQIEKTIAELKSVGAWNILIEAERRIVVAKLKMIAATAIIEHRDDPKQSQAYLFGLELRIDEQ